MPQITRAAGSEVSASALSRALSNAISSQEAALARAPADCTDELLEARAATATARSATIELQVQVGALPPDTVLDEHVLQVHPAILAWLPAPFKGRWEPRTSYGSEHPFGRVLVLCGSSGFARIPAFL